MQTKKTVFIIIFSLFVSTAFIYCQNVKRESLKNAEDSIFSPGEQTGIKGLYFGQQPPGLQPKVFAPGIISTEENREFSGTFSPDGKDYYFFRFADGAGLMECKLLDDGWTAPKPAPFNTEYIDYEPHITHDGKYMFFGSNRPYPGNKEKRRMTQLWVMERINDSWGPPKHLRMGMFATSSKYDNIYLEFGVFKLVDGKLSKLKDLICDATVPPNGREPGHHICIAFDESYLIFDSQVDSQENLFICFRKKDGSWSESIDLGSKLNLPGGKMLATLSQDNKYLFFCNKGDIYWVSTKIIEGLKPIELK